MADPTSFERELSRFWNDVAAGGAGNPDGLDAETTAAIRRLHHLAAAPLPSSARERVWRRLKTADSARRDKGEGVTIDADVLSPRFGRSPNGRERAARVSPVLQVQPATRRVRSRPSLWIALAAILIVLAGGWWLFGDRLPGNGDDSHALIPAAQMTPTATPDPASYNGVLIDYVIANQPLKTQYVDVEEVHFNPGYGFGGNYAVDSNFVELVTEGEITVTVDGPIQVIRGIGGSPQTVAANSPQVLRAGDAIAIGPRTTFKNEHDGELPATFVSFNLLDPNISGPSQTNDALYQITQGNGTFAPGPLRLVVRRITLNPGQTYARPTSGPFLLIGVEDPNSAFTGYFIGDATNNGTTPANLLVMTLEPVGGKNTTLVYASSTPTPAP